MKIIFIPTADVCVPSLGIYVESKRKWKNTYCRANFVIFQVIINFFLNLLSKYYFCK